MGCVCDHEDCPDDGYCTTSGSCYSFVTAERDQRGCFDSRLAKMQCGSINSQHAAIGCCYEQLCNHEVAVTLPSENAKPFLTADEQAKLLLIGAISGGVLVMAHRAGEGAILPPGVAHSAQLLSPHLRLSSVNVHFDSAHPFPRATVRQLSKLPSIQMS